MKAFGRMGFKFSHQTGSHMLLYRENEPPLSVPNHRELATGTLRALIKKAGLTVEEFIELL